MPPQATSLVSGREVKSERKPRPFVSRRSNQRRPWVSIGSPGISDLSLGPSSRANLSYGYTALLRTLRLRCASSHVPAVRRLPTRSPNLPHADVPPADSYCGSLLPRFSMYPYSLPLFRPLVLSSAQEQGVTIPGEPSSPICFFGKPTMRAAARGSVNDHPTTPVGSSQGPVDDPPFLSPPLLGAAQNGRVNSATLVGAAVRIEPAGWQAVCCTKLARFCVPVLLVPVYEEHGTRFPQSSSNPSTTKFQPSQGPIPHLANIYHSPFVSM
ncbi:hypothetical protein CSAL01_05164 [Colletotrichum salicis]|uniref:Uncharacterized protein n=1 Tax=Colletotrichum salicis TaxID=1209931 RepID=A0A135V7X4_9PEZI|nr:hypothetical protein CSAL01_05164 [Colletotrichum salicis]